jgi:hypothetical protein
VTSILVVVFLSVRYEKHALRTLPILTQDVIKPSVNPIVMSFDFSDVIFEEVIYQVLSTLRFVRRE